MAALIEQDHLAPAERPSGGLELGRAPHEAMEHDDRRLGAREDQDRELDVAALDRASQRLHTATVRSLSTWGAVPDIQSRWAAPPLARVVAQDDAARLDSLPGSESRSARSGSRASVRPCLVGFGT